MGAITKAVPFTNLYAQLERRRVEAQENPPGFIRSHKLYKVQKYLMLTNHIPQRQFVFTGAAMFKSQSSRDAKIIRDAAQEASHWVTKEALTSQKHDIEWLEKEGGMTIVDINLDGVDDLLKTIPRELAGQNGINLLSDIEGIK